MNGPAVGWGLLLVAVVAANLPFLSERILLLGPKPAHKAFVWRLLELVLLSALVVGLGLFVEGRQGQRHPQEWQFYATLGCLMLVFAFPGFVWRHLRRGAHGG